MGPVMYSVAGVRGVVGESLTPELVTRFATAFGTFRNSGTIIVGRDTRVSGMMLKYLVFGGLMSAGCKVIDLDITPTPTVALMVKELGAHGAVVISGSHNPAEWNALKFFNEQGMYLNEAEWHQLQDLFYQGGFRTVNWQGLQDVTSYGKAGEVHLHRVLGVVHAAKVRKAHLRVVLDSCNGAGSLITPKLLERLGCAVVRVNCEPSGLFPHNPEPIFTNLADLCRTVVEAKADVGFAQDADADRLAIVNQHGEYLGEEYTLALVARHVLRRRKGLIVTNLSTSRLVEDVAREFGGRVVRTRVHEIHVAERMRTEAAILGGEGNGGVIDPRVHLTRDSLVAVALLLEELAETGKSVAQLVDELPRYVICKRKLPTTYTATMNTLTDIKNRYQPQAETGAVRIDYTDGIRLDWDDAWVHIRPSGTEPAIRIIAEAATAERAEALCSEFLAVAREHSERELGGEALQAVET
jgi:phosphomannomutase